MSPISHECMKHAGKSTAWFCPECDATLCDACIRNVVAVVGPRACPYCGQRLKQADPRELAANTARQAPQAARPDRSGHRIGSAGDFMNVMFYPFQGRGKWMLVGGTILYVLLGLCRWVPFIGGLVAVTTMGYAVSYLMKIIHESANGEPEPPDWPDIHNLVDGIFVPLVRGLGCLVVSFFPLVALFVWRLVNVFTGSSLPFDVTATHERILLVIGAAYLPMALLAVSLWDSVAAAGPHKVLPAIVRVGLPYLFVVALLAGMLVVVHLLWATLYDTILHNAGLPGYMLGYAMGFLVSMYSLMLIGRVVGLLYNVYGKRIQWFD